jgi:hypothetical protein
VSCGKDQVFVHQWDVFGEGSGEVALGFGGRAESEGMSTLYLG